MRSRLLSVTAAAAVVVPGLLMLGASPAVAADDAQVAIFHGVPGATVDVYVNGDLLLEDFKPGTLTDPLALAAGTYKVAIYSANAKPKTEDPIIGPANIPVDAGMNYTVAAYLDAKGNPTAGAFVNDTSTVAAGEARVTVRHLAAAPAVNIEANGNVLFAKLTNGNEAMGEVPADTYKVAVVPAAGGAAVLSTDLPAAEGANTIVYAWGSLNDDNLALATQVIDGLHSAPGAIPAGEVGLAGTQGGQPAWSLGLAAAAALVAAAASVRLVRSRS
ncbi:MAG: DUF4397 domain-containing protein [Actinomycetes bacterium]